MPKSKHRRKSGQKALKSPGRSKLPGPAIDRRLDAFNLFNERYRSAIEEHLDNAAIGFMVDLIIEKAFVFRAGKSSLQTVSKAKLYEEFFSEEEELDTGRVSFDGGKSYVFIDGGGEILPALGFEEAEASLLLLTEHDMVRVEDDQITVPDRFLSD